MDTTQGGNTTAKLFRPPLLHDHIDGCKLLLPVLPALFELSGKPYPFGKTGNDWDEVKVVFRNPQIDIVEKFSNTTGVMQSCETLELAGYAYTTGRAKEGYKYCEATIAPQYHTFRGLKPEQIVAAFIEGIKRGEKEYPQIEVNVLFSVGREVKPEEAIKLVEAAARCDRDYVVGIGLVCDEASHPPGKHTAMFQRAIELGFKTTAHAGEWVNVYPAKPNPARDRNQLIENIGVAIIGLGVNRIGHAIPLAQSGPLIELVLDGKIGVELCPGSNLNSGLIPNMEYLRIRDLLNAGVLCSLNPDDDLFLPDMDETLVLCDAEYHFTNEELNKLHVNAWMSRFGRRKPARIL